MSVSVTLVGKMASLFFPKRGIDSICLDKLLFISSDNFCAFTPKGWRWCHFSSSQIQPFTVLLVCNTWRFIPRSKLDLHTPTCSYKSKLCTENSTGVPESPNISDLQLPVPILPQGCDELRLWIVDLIWFTGRTRIITIQYFMFGCYM